MGTLYLAWDPQLERNVAIKVLRQNDEALRRRFLREARSAARLQHRHIITVYDVGSHEGAPFIAMEYIPGFTLSTVIKERRDVPVEQKLRWIEELCDGLGYAHAAGIVHRDIKPANLMIDGSGGVQILDFGIARVHQAGNLTQAGTVLGTLNYMSPEQLSGREIDHRSDIHAVGAVLYELLTYRQAFPGSIADGVVGLILQAQPEALEQLVPSLDAEISAMVGRALQKQPDDRYQDLDAMRRDLARVRLGTGPTAQYDTVQLTGPLHGTPSLAAPPAPPGGVPAAGPPSGMVGSPDSGSMERGAREGDAVHAPGGGAGAARAAGATPSSPPTVVRSVPQDPSPTPGGVPEPEPGTGGAPREGFPWRFVAVAAALVILIPTGFMLLQGDEPTVPVMPEEAVEAPGGSAADLPLSTIEDSTDSPGDSTGLLVQDSIEAPEEVPVQPPPARDTARRRVAPPPLPAECAELLGRFQVGEELTEEEEEFLRENCRR